MAKQRPNTYTREFKQQKTSRVGSFFVVVLLVFFLALTVVAATFNDFRKGRQLTVETDRILFVGDVFLGRRIETYIKQYGAAYPFERIADVFKKHTDIIGNFESAVPATHRQTRDLTYTFSTDASYVGILNDFGFTGVSLANNHTLDYGDDGYKNTKQVFAAFEIKATGHPNVVEISDIQYYDLGDKIIAVIPLNLTYGDHALVGFDSVQAHAANTSDYQIVYVHWGIEYKLVASEHQRRVAYDLIDSGVDAIIGHHPHVVQDIERYKKGVIFYSLGNFVFDQFNNPEREQGLALSFYSEDDMLYYDLIPVTSEDQRSSPRPMTTEERGAFLNGLAGRSDKLLKDSIQEGRIQHVYDI